MPIAYADELSPDSILYNPSEEEDDLEYEGENMSQNEKEPLAIPTCLGFHPPPDKPIPGLRPRKSRGQKAMLRTVGADG